MMTNRCDLRTSEEWFQKLCEKRGTVIVAPTGWDMKNIWYSWNDQLITKDEFYDRLNDSVCMLQRTV